MRWVGAAFMLLTVVWAYAKGWMDGRIYENENSRAATVGREQR